HGGAHDLVGPVQRHLERGVVERLRADERLAHEVAAAGHAHLRRFGEADLDHLAVSVGPHLADEEVAVVAETRVLAPEEAEHESSVALLCSASSMARLIDADSSGISEAAAHLRAGGLVAFPTETVYGLGASAQDREAVARVFAAKGRPRQHPLIVHLPDAGALWRWADREAQAERGVDPATVEALAQRFWPGPVTLVLHALPGVDRAVTGGQDTVAVRVPASPVALDLLAAFGGPVVAPSANRFGRVSPTRADHVLAEFAGEDVLVLDGGPTEHGLESTILDLSGPEPRLLRPGALPLERLREVVPVSVAADGAPRAPGTLARHYAPATPLRAVAGGDLERELVGERGVVARREPRGAVPYAPFSAAGAPPPE